MLGIELNNNIGIGRGKSLLDKREKGKNTQIGTEFYSKIL